MLLADREYDADWIRELVRQQGAWANIPPKRNRKDPICLSAHLYRARNLVERFFNRIKQCQRIATRYTNSRPTIWPSSNSYQSEFGCVLMRPRPNCDGWPRSAERKLLSVRHNDWFSFSIFGALGFPRSMRQHGRQIDDACAVVDRRGLHGGDLMLAQGLAHDVEPARQWRIAKRPPQWRRSIHWSAARPDGDETPRRGRRPAAHICVAGWLVGAAGLGVFHAARPQEIGGYAMLLFNRDHGWNAARAVQWRPAVGATSPSMRSPKGHAPPS